MELLSGTVAQNISRFEPNAAPEAVRAAAAAAGVHEMIVSLPDGYGMKIGERGPSCRRDRHSGSRSRVRSIAIRFWWCWMSRIPI